MTNLEYYRQQIINNIEDLMREQGCEYELALGKVITLLWNFSDNYTNAVDWLCEEHKEPLLNDDEKEYFYQVQEALDINIKNIRKQEWNNGTEYIQIVYYTGLEESSISLPVFKANEKFKNLNLSEPYSAEELGL